MSNEKQSLKLGSGNYRTPKGRLSYPFLFEPNPKAKTKEGKLKYQTSLLIPPDADLSLLKQAAADCAKEKWGEKFKDMKLKSPFLDAFEKTDDEKFKGWTMLRVSTTRKPWLVMADGKTVPEPHEVYAGRWAYISVNPGWYDVDGNKGVSFFLVNGQILDNDEPLASSSVRAETEFEPVAGAAESSGAASADPFA